MSAPLSKKQQKAQSFRAKQKAKRAAVPDLPEQDDDVEVSESADLASTSTSAKAKPSKAKAEPAVDEDEAYAPLPEKKKDDSADGEKAGGKKKRKRTDGDGTEDAEIEGYGKVQKHRRVTEPKPKKEVAQRFILFLGNIGFKTTKDEVAAHFKESVGRIPAVRLLTDKATGKSRGIAFLELANGNELQSALKQHHSILNGKRINVELTAGGGGKSEGRREKLKQRNERVSTQREKREKEAKEKEAKAKAAKGDQAGQAAEQPPIVGEMSNQGAKIGAGGGGGDAGWGAPIGEGYKMRGGRRVKVKPSGGPGGDRERRPQRPKWQPTGANAQPLA
ncbi:hypothetical protein A1Q2_08186 [Trichosporon asahii var. asahii CBS 8904]|uniref:Nucleolar protein 12 n=1 Tax=Trichosporon asahii var. asahii (strain CBS 8904) TaxID=1220162 RepID=K1VL94_TRIAC|nr:hypothetical protein A1Q2_08186 [Trichosporon asahii var. asahii CBS 8904]